MRSDFHYTLTPNVIATCRALHNFCEEEKENVNLPGQKKELLWNTTYDRQVCIHTMHLSALGVRKSGMLWQSI